MRPLFAIAAVALLAGCQSSDLGDYHHEVAHPYRVSEAAVRLPLVGMTAEQAAAQAAGFATERPNAGSSFIVSAPTPVANAVRLALLHSGVDARDVRLVPEGEPAELVRVDRFATVDNCRRAPEKRSIGDFMFLNEPGWSRDNINSELLGCAVRRNTVEMVVDPRALVGPAPMDGRDGVKAADVYTKWSRGSSPWAGYSLPTWNTSDITEGGSGQ